MSAEKLYRKIKSEMLFNRAVMSIMAALVIACIKSSGESKNIFLILILHTAYYLARSFEEWMRGDG